MREPPRQIPFELSLDASGTREDFFVTASNKDAMAWIDRWPSWDMPLLFVCGPAGCGKSHLLNIWQQRVMQLPQQAQRSLPIDDIDLKLATPEAQEELFHALNRLRENGGTMLATATMPPAAWDMPLLPDLRSRLLAAAVVTIQPPDDALLSAMLAKLFSDRQLAVGAEVIQYIVTRAPRSFMALADIVHTLDTRAMAEKRAVTVPLVRQVLEQPETEKA